MKPNSRLFFFGCVFGMLSLFFSHYNVYAIDREKILFFNDIDGLPRNIVTCVEQDTYGYTWIGTGNGISRYNGDVFKNYEQLKGHNIRSIVINTKNELWLASEHGIYVYNRITDQFEIKYEGYVHSLCQYQDRIYFNTIASIRLFEESGITEMVIGDNIGGFCVNSRGIWYSNSFDGIRLRSHHSTSDTSKSVLSGRYVSIIRDIDGHLFMGGRNGQLFVLRNGEKEIEVKIKNHHSIHEIIKVDDEYWMATDGNGVIILDENFNYSRSLDKGFSRNSRLNSNSIYDIYLGSTNEVWVATYGAGLGCLMYDDSPFKNIIPDIGNRNSLIAREGVSVFEKDNKIYFGTNYGMSVLNENNGLYTHYPMHRLKRDLQGAKVLAVNTDAENNFWVGTYDGLLGKYSPDFKFIRSYKPCGNEANDMQRIVFIEKYGEDNLLILTHYHNRSLLNFNLKNLEFTPVTLEQGGSKNSNLNVISIRKNKVGETIVLLRSDGLFTVNIEKNILENDLPEINKRITFRLLDFYQDKNGYYWLATQKDGLVRMSEDGREFDKWTTEQGLPTNSLLRLESSDDKHLWISTISGLCRFDMETGAVLNFNHGHGLPANEFTQRASIRTQDGRLIFGSNAGFTIVDPEKVYTQVTESKVVISDITFQNQSIKNTSDNPILKVPLEETKIIELPFRKNSFAIHFFAHDKDLPKYNNYAYRLLGLEDEWIYLGKTKQTTYTNLSPGTYTFEVKNTNNSNVWSDTPTQLQIEITPPWYLAWPAFVGYILLFFLTVHTIHVIYTNRVHLKKELEMSEYKVEQEHELTEKKLAFFTNISHDLKTPLTLIDAPVNDLLDSDGISAEQKSKLLIVKRNSRRLYKLISDILDFRKLTQRQLPLKVSESKIDEAIENIYEAFKSECTKKQIDFQVNNSIHEFIFVEVKKIEKILWNLLSNALKFSENEGEIYLSAEKEIIDNKAFLKLIVKDSGIGIPKEERINIFKRFYQKRDEAKGRSDGTGIGLSIVKDLVELHHGTIDVDSILGAGSTFTVIIPVEKTAYKEDEIGLYFQGADEQSPKPVIFIEENSVVSDNKNNYYNLPILLLVEDNVELREYMAGYFSKKYKVYQASDGVVGLEFVNRKKPDVIITDILMPNMDGHEFCKTIRAQFDTSHLPILMLTANGMVEQQIEGLTAGADAYVTKPFDIKYLDTLVHSILENRKKIRNRILGMSDDGKEGNKLSEKDVEFVDDLRLCIKNNLSNPHLSVELLSEHFAISRTQLNRKIKSLTGQTPNNLIKSVRLRVAYELIHEKGLRVSEAAYKTGFSDPNYFTICFKKEFGENPSQIVAV